MKSCSKCKQNKIHEEFHKNKARYDGYCNFCKQCSQNRKIDKSKKALYEKKYRLENAEKVKKYQSAYYIENKNKYAIRNKAWIENNKERWLFLGRSNASKVKTKKRHKFQEAKRRAIKINATPKWANLTIIKEIYMNCPEGFHVDHIIPLNHPLVCGLHVPWNLQYLPALENIKKNNKIEGLSGK